MPRGIRVCSKCSREVHQGKLDLETFTRPWEHCEDDSPICEKAGPKIVESEKEIVGRYCTMDA